MSEDIEVTDLDWVLLSRGFTGVSADLIRLGKAETLSAYRAAVVVAGLRNRIDALTAVANAANGFISKLHTDDLDASLDISSVKAALKAAGFSQPTPEKE
jgi:hypothetical protein